MKVNFRIAALATLVVFFGGLASCSADEEPQAENEIIDEGGLEITLEWSTGGSSSQSIDDVDLDLDLVLGEDRVDDSSSSFSFESVELSAFFADGTYDVNVEYFGGQSAVTYTLFVDGKITGRSLEYTGVFESSDAGTTITDINIRKEGNVYTILD